MNTVIFKVNEDPSWDEQRKLDDDRKAIEDEIEDIADDSKVDDEEIEDIADDVLFNLLCQ